MASSIGGWVVARAVVSGGAGFIGSHLCERLLERGVDVLVLDNLVTGAQSNLDHLRSRPGFEFLEHDVSKPVEVAGGVDFVFHFASPASPVDFARIPIEIVKVGTLGTHNMLGLALAKDARFLLASTSEVYGDPLVHPQPESYSGNVNPTGVRACYDESKRCAEAFTMAYHRAHGLKTRILRIFNTYGPRMRLGDGRVIPNYMSQALRGEPLTVYGDGSQTRSLCYVDDLVEGALAVMGQDDPMPFNIGTQDEITMLELARIIQRLAQSPSPIEFRALPQDDPRQRRPDTARAESRLGWRPRWALEDGLRLTLDQLRSVL
ncbi:MAG TPA: UDP-glucuronic acid decarboxylase family protein [Candidatus Nitrosotalea sp.]|nr:UDP-glucuronic acid decarboxylase family protein [Candidatus Nitrosotalea sp.]